MRNAVSRATWFNIHIVADYSLLFTFSVISVRSFDITLYSESIEHFCLYVSRLVEFSMVD